MCKENKDANNNKYCELIGDFTKMDLLVTLKRAVFNCGRVGSMIEMVLRRNENN